MDKSALPTGKALLIRCPTVGCRGISDLPEDSSFENQLDDTDS
jgi:hypothetical protein